MEAATVGCWGGGGMGHNGPDNQPAECPSSFFPTGGVSGDRAPELADASRADTELGLCQRRTDGR